MEARAKTKTHVRTIGAIAVIDVEGDLTPDAREEVETAHQNITAAGVRKVVLSFKPDAYINSGGIAIIINIAIAGHEGRAVDPPRPAVGTFPENLHDGRSPAIRGDLQQARPMPSPASDLHRAFERPGASGVAADGQGFSACG